jgi:starvation-inducible DNA-binding protein
MSKSFPTKIDIPEEQRKALVELLNARLADTFDLYSQVKQAHWNVKGTDFIQLHELFDSLAGDLLGHIDDLAERVTTLGGTALGTARMAAATSKLPEYPDDVADGNKHVGLLADRYGVYANLIRESADEADGLGDMGTNDLLIEVSRQADKHLWFLEAHLQA